MFTLFILLSFKGAVIILISVYFYKVPLRACVFKFKVGHFNVPLKGVYLSLSSIIIFFVNFKLHIIASLHW